MFTLVFRFVPSPHLHGDFYCNCRYAAMTSLMQAGSPLGPSPYGWGLVPFFLAPLPVLETG
jgi:hypothetical protein